METLRRQLAFNDLITAILARFTSAAGAEIGAHIQTSLREIGQFAAADYAFVVDISHDQSTWSVTHEWCAPEIPSQLAVYQKVPMGTFDWSERAILAGEIVRVDSLDDIPPEAVQFRERLKSLGFKSTLQLPFRGRDGRVTGCVALSAVRHELTWTDADVQRLRLLGEALANALERQRADQELREALQEIKRLSDRLRAENLYLQEEITVSQGFDEIVGQSELLRSTLSKVEHVAGTDASVLLLGETGTGKELLARAIHNRSQRRDHPLVKVNLAALSSSLIESELFGHVKGAFTGAVSEKVGRFELADGGTLFLDEIGELDPELQTKLLRVLQEGEFERIGSAETMHVDVRVVSATNRDLHGAMEQGRFRPDLYYRLAVFPIEVPPLRLRRDDIPLLVWHFVLKKQARLGKTIETIPEGVMARLVAYDWPGNIRELENVIERAMILCPSGVLLMEERLKGVQRDVSAAPPPRGKRLDRAQIVNALDHCGWKIKGAGHAAERLGMKPSTLRHRMKVLGIRRPEVSSETGTD